MSSRPNSWGLAAYSPRLSCALWLEPGLASAPSINNSGAASPCTTPITQGLLEVNRLWAAAQHELAIARDDVVETPAPAGAGRGS